MALSPNYSWAEPDNSSLVKNGASDIRTLGDAIDTSVWNVGFGQAGKNKLINGDFGINQRGFTSSTSTSYGFDRFNNVVGGGTGTATSTPQVFTPGTAPVAGYESANYLRIVTTGQSATSTITRLQQSIEDVRTFAGQTATFSFWAKAATGTPSISLELSQNYGSGGSPSAQINIVGGKVAITTSWARYSVTVAVPSLTGKTLGTTANTSALDFRLWFSAGSDFNARTGSLGIQSNTFEVWGCQAEYGSKATPFQTATGTIQGELSACQRYYQRITADSAYGGFAVGGAASATIGYGLSTLTVTMRVLPTSLDFANVAFINFAGAATALSSLVIDANSNKSVVLVTGTGTGLTLGQTGRLGGNNNAAGYLGFSAEL